MSEKKEKMPLYLEIKQQILSEISGNNFTPGQKMPTERELARRLNISRNTVSLAYDELIRDGVLTARQGRGTFVNCVDQPQRKQRALEAIAARIDELLDEAFFDGLAAEDFQAAVLERVRFRQEMMQHVRAVFIECNVEQARIFAREITELTQVGTVPLTLSALRQHDPAAMAAMADTQFIFTTFNHLSEVRALAGNDNQRVFGVAVRPCLQGLVRIAQFPPATSFCLVSISEEFHAKFERNLQSAGLQVNIRYTNSGEQAKLLAMISACDVVIVSPGRCREIKELIAGKKEVIVFNTTLDAGSAKAILPLIRNHKNNM